MTPSSIGTEAMHRGGRAMLVAHFVHEELGVDGVDREVIEDVKGYATLVARLKRAISDASSVSEPV